MSRADRHGLVAAATRSRTISTFATNTGRCTNVPTQGVDRDVAASRRLEVDDRVRQDGSSRAVASRWKVDAGPDEYVRPCATARSSATVVKTRVSPSSARRSLHLYDHEAYTRPSRATPRSSLRWSRRRTVVTRSVGSLPLSQERCKAKFEHAVHSSLISTDVLVHEGIDRCLPARPVAQGIDDGSACANAMGLVISGRV